MKDGRRVYGDVHQDADGTASFEVLEETEYLWLVVSGAPTEHWPDFGRRGGSSADKKPEEECSY